MDNNKKIKTQTFSRVTGYIRPIQSWNVGKQQEWEDREFYNKEDKK
jgi:anaerobic ribonucleoside-triphosphate reductase